MTGNTKEWARPCWDRDGGQLGEAVSPGGEGLAGEKAEVGQKATCLGTALTGKAGLLFIG